MDVLCIGEALIDFVSQVRGVDLVTATQYVAATGGAPANVAAGLAALGRQARLIATVGNDAFGQKIRHDLEAWGVDCQLRVDEEHFTTLAFVKQRAGGDRVFEFNAGAHDYLLPEQITAEDVRAARVLHFGSISLRHPTSRQATLNAVRYAKEAGVVCSCDPNWRPTLWADAEAGRAAMCEVLAHTDILKISDSDLSMLAPDCGDDYHAGLQAVGFQGRLATVTLGRAGAWYQAGERFGQVSSPDVKVAESTGAGDAFLAALLDVLLAHDLDVASMDDKTLKNAVARACAAGALAATNFGATSAIPDAAAIDTMVRMLKLGMDDA